MCSDVKCTREKVNQGGWLRNCQAENEKECVRAQLLQSCPTLCNAMDSNPPGFSVHGILQAGVHEWVAISFSRGSSRPRD